MKGVRCSWVTPQPVVGSSTAAVPMAVVAAHQRGRGGVMQWTRSFRPYHKQLTMCTCMRVVEECSGGGGVPWGGLANDGCWPWRLGRAGRTWAVQHRDLGYQLAMENGRGEAWGLTITPID
jgi:hypothetical protein